jgi:hypothetical protein
MECGVGTCPSKSLKEEVRTGINYKVSHRLRSFFLALEVLKFFSLLIFKRFEFNSVSRLCDRFLTSPLFPNSRRQCAVSTTYEGAVGEGKRFGVDHIRDPPQPPGGPGCLPLHPQHQPHGTYIIHSSYTVCFVSPAPSSASFFILCSLLCLEVVQHHPQHQPPGKYIILLSCALCFVWRWCNTILSTSLMV